MNRHVVEVIVRGRFGPELVAALPDFTVESDDSGRTRLIGEIPDQAKLFGMLEMFDQLHVEVISVNPVPPGEVFTPPG